MKKLTVIGIATLLLVAFTMPAMAEVHIGGLIFTDMYYFDRDKDNQWFRTAGIVTGAPVGEGLTETRIQLPIITRLYGRWTNEDNVGMYIEFGLGGPTSMTGSLLHDIDDAVNVRHAYGWWDVNPAFTLMVGHSTTPFSPLFPSQLLGTMSGEFNIVGLGYGDFYSGRFPQVRGTFKFGKMAKLEIALVNANNTGALFQNEAGILVGRPNSGNEPYTEAGFGVQRDSKLPRVDITLPLYLGPVQVYPGFLYQHKSFNVTPVSGVTTGNPDTSIDTIVGSLGIKAGFGPFAIAAEGNYGQNWGNTPSVIGFSPAGLLSTAYLNDKGEVQNTDTYSFWVDVSFKFGPITPHVMYGQMKSKMDGKFYNTGTSDMEAKSQMIGFSVPIQLAKGFSIRPECVWYDDGDISSNQPSVHCGKYAIYGVQFQITF
jgi:hypothetical protein